MFDSVGRREDPEWRKRQAASLVSTLVLAGFVGFLSGVAALEQGQQVSPEPDLPLVMLEEEDVAPPGPADLPAPPAAPPAAPAHGVAEEAAPEEAETPSESPPPLQPIDARLRDVSGTPDGIDGGVGEEGGAADGAGTSQGLGGGGGGPVASVLRAEARHLAQPRYPDAARAMNLGEQVCRAHVSLSAKGWPEEVRVTGCPEVFHPAVRDAMRRSRWYPVRVGRERIRATTLVAVRFVLR